MQEKNLSMIKMEQSKVPWFLSKIIQLMQHKPTDERMTCTFHNHNKLRKMQVTETHIKI